MVLGGLNCNKYSVAIKKKNFPCLVTSLTKTNERKIPNFIFRFLNTGKGKFREKHLLPFSTKVAERESFGAVEVEKCLIIA